MKTMLEIQLELLQEIDKICQDNNLKYILVGKNALKAYLTHSFKDGVKLIDIAMTPGDIDRFCEIVEKQHSNNRYVEGMFNNPKITSVYVTYGNKNTTYFNMINLKHENHHGIHIRIYPIHKFAKLDGTTIVSLTPRLQKEKRLRELLTKIIENDKLWYLKAGQKSLNFLYSLTGGGKRYYNEVRKNIFIDKWENIQDYLLVRIDNHTINSKCLNELQRYDVDGIELNLPKDGDAFFKDFYNMDISEMHIIDTEFEKAHMIVNTEIGYEKLISETEHLIKEARKTHEKILIERKKCEDENKTVRNVWQLVKMTDDEMQYRQYFEDKIDDLMKLDLNNKKEFEKVNHELRNPIMSLKKYARKGMTFSIDPETDALIKKVLIKNGEEEFVKKLNQIAQKEYFVE